MKTLCIAYLIFLTALLLTADPASLIGIPASLIGIKGGTPLLLQALMPYAHLLSFMVLAVLALLARWPVPRWALVLLMVVYSGTTEVAQSFLPPRAAEWLDWLQNLGGIAIGVSVCWSLSTSRRLFRVREDGDQKSPPNSEWEVVHRVMSRPRVGEESWWG
jgi:hypothetical protein